MIRVDYKQKIIYTSNFRPAQKALEADIKAATSVAELQALALLEHEFPLVYNIQSVQDLFRRRREEIV